MLQRPIFIEHYGSSAKLGDSSAPFLSSIKVPAPNWWIPAPHFCRALRFQRQTGGFQRLIFIEHYGSSAVLVDSSAPSLGSITVPAPHWWIPAPHSYAALRFQRPTDGFQRPMLMLTRFAARRVLESRDLFLQSGSLAAAGP